MVIPQLLSSNQTHAADELQTLTVARGPGFDTLQKVVLE